MRRKSVESKIKEGYGKGTGKDYKPFLETREFSPISTTYNTIDWKTGRTVELLSQIEAKIWYILRWSDNVVDIREQFPLDLKTTLEIAENHGIRHPMSNGDLIVMTTDFLVTFNDGTELAIYVKYNDNDWKKTPRDIEKAFIQKKYWTEYKHTAFKMLSSKDVNETLYRNIEKVSEFYNKEYVFDEISELKHKIATKQIKVDMYNSILDFRNLLKQYGGK